MTERRSSATRVDGVDLRALKYLLNDVESPMRATAREEGTNERTVARRVETMKRDGIFRGRSRSTGRPWHRAVAPQGCKASAGEDQKPRLYRFINRQTRIMERFSTVGRDE